MKNSLWAAFLLFSAAVSPAEAFSEPKLCLGYFPGDEWGNRGEMEYCPASMAINSFVPAPVSSNLPPEKVRFYMSCCPLPADDILTPETRHEKVECPENFVATGLVSVTDRSKNRITNDSEWELICTKINLARYQLGTRTPSVYWGFGATAYWQKQHYARTDIPPAIRTGVGRTSRFVWFQSGCIGMPMGSLLVKKTSKRCHGNYFIELQYRGIAGDPPAGTPVKMFPDCRGVSDPLDPNATCVE